MIAGNMFPLFAETRFWTHKNVVQIRNTDFGAFRFQEKKDVAKNDIYAVGKESYGESRGNSTLLRNRRPERLRSRVRELEQIIQTQKIVSCSPRPDGCFSIITSTGLFIQIKTNLLTCSLEAVKFDRYLVGKVSEICDVTSTKSHMILSHTENQLTLVYFAKPLTSANYFEKLQKLDPKVQLVDLVGGAGRRLHRHVSSNTDGDLVLTWWQTSNHEVYPWAPNVKDWDRANVHIYSISGTHLELVAYFRTESEPICVQFSSRSSNVLWAIEQKVSRKGEVTVESSCYQLLKKQLVKKSVTSVSLQTHVSCYAFDPLETRLALGCIDGSLVLLDEDRGVTRQVRAAFIPTVLRWHNDGALLLCGNDRAQFQFFDLALSCVRTQLLSEDVTPANLMDLGPYFTVQPALIDMKWSYKEIVPFYGSKYVPNDSFVLLMFEGGPLATLSLVGGGGLQGDVHLCGLTADTLVTLYLSWHQVDRAISLLLSLDWNREGALCLASLYRITNAIFRAALTPERELQLETTLGSFHAPIKPLSSAVYLEFSDQVHDLTRRFFHQLVRFNLYEKAFCLAVDLNDRDLYLDLLVCARRLGDREMAAAVQQQLRELNDNSGESSCSCDGSSDDEHQHHQHPPLPNLNDPPLPEISRFGRHRESAFFTKTQPSAFSVIPEEPASPPPGLATDLQVDSTLPSVIEKLYDLPSRPRLTTDRIKGTSPAAKNFVPDVGKSTSALSSLNTLSSTLPYISTPAAHFSSILGPSSSVSGLYAPNFAPNSSNLTAPPFSFSSYPSSPPKFPANPLSSHLYGVATKASEQKSAPVKPKVKFSDTVTQIVVPDISEISGDKPRRVKGIDPAKELADSLPLCLGNKDYLKNFSKPDEDDELHGATIKVIHFGVV